MWTNCLGELLDISVMVDVDNNLMLTLLFSVFKVSCNSPFSHCLQVELVEEA